MNTEMNEHSPLNHNQQPTAQHRATGPMITGLLLVILGIVLLFAQFFGQRFMSNFWPFLFIAGGLIFYAVYFIRFTKPAGFEGMLFPGTYLVILGVLFFILNLIGWYNMVYLWPTFVLAVAVSLGAIYLFSPKEQTDKRKDLLSSIKVLIIISAVLYVIAAGGLYLWPLALVIIGLIIIFKALVGK